MSPQVERTRAMITSLRSLASHKHAPLVGSAAAVGVMGAVLSTRHGADSSQKPPKLSVMTFNVLARPYTKYNQQFHRASSKIEDETQTRTRYTLAGEEIAAKGTDIVFLQECEAAFFDPAWNYATSKLLDRYHVFACRRKSDDNVESPGTAVLVKKTGGAIAKTTSPICIGGEKKTGGLSKVATVVAMEYGEKTFDAVSTHFAFDGNSSLRQHHAQLIGDQLKGSSVILGGDFNCQPGEPLKQLESATFLGDLNRAALREGATTGLSGDFSKQEYIDHVYSSRDWSALKAAALREPRPPYAGEVTRPAKVSGASDHVPVVVELEAR